MIDGDGLSVTGNTKRNNHNHRQQLKESGGVECADTAGVFEAVLSNRAGCGLVPYESSVAGIDVTSRQMLCESGLKVERWEGGRVYGTGRQTDRQRERQEKSRLKLHGPCVICECVRVSA